MGFWREGLYCQTPEEARKEKEIQLQNELEYLEVLDPIVHKKIYGECLDNINRLKEELSKLILEG